MRSIFTSVLIVVLCPLWLLAQDDKRDYVWVMGDTPNIPTQEFGGCRINFKKSPPTTEYFNINYDFSAISAISDQDGELAFYTNGCHIISTTNKIMENGSPLNEGPVFDVYCGNGGYPSSQPIICLPYPGHPDQYMVLHIRVELTNDGVWYKNILSTVVDMSKNAGLGTVIDRNHQLAQGDLNQNNFTQCITATRHGNGRDWWIVAPTHSGKKNYLFLLTPDGIKGPFIRQNPQGLEFWAVAQIGFSPDGTWFCEGTGKSQFRLSRFDRCSGEFYDQRVYDFQGDTVHSMGVSFSPSSQRLYVSQPLKIYQYDLTKPDIQASRQVVAQYDGFVYKSSSCTFFQAMLAPDNKIYLTASSATWHLHIIHHPDSLGIACGVEQHGLKMPAKHSFQIPNFPHFRLYDLHGSPCDTLGINGPTSAAGEPPEEGEKAEMRLWPNPATDQLTIQFPASILEGIWHITDMSGRVLRSGQKSTSTPTFTLPIADLLSGMYCFQFQLQDGTVLPRRFVVVR